MAQAVMTALLKGGVVASDLIATTRSESSANQVAQQFGVQASCDNSAAVAQADIVVLGIKPQQAHEVLLPLQSALAKRKPLIISLMAGVKLDTLLELTQCEQVVRTMPNLPVQFGLGVTGCVAASELTEPMQQQVTKLFEYCGQVIWLETEAELDNLMSLTGCGPAYVFYLMDALQEAAVDLGLDAQQAKSAVKNLILGSATYAYEDDASFAELKARVASKGGTTAEALAVFDQANLKHIIATAMQAAINKARKL